MAAAAAAAGEPASPIVRQIIDDAGHKVWAQPLCCGWLTKQGSFAPTWKRRYFVFFAQDQSLFYYPSEQARAPLQLIPTLPSA